MLIYNKDKIKDKMIQGIKLLGIGSSILATMTIIITLILILNGFVLSKLWEWFIVTIFDVPVISISLAIGFLMISGLFFSFVTGFSTVVKCLLIERPTKPNVTANDDFISVDKIYGYAVGFPLLILLIGWIVHLFV